MQQTAAQNAASGQYCGRSFATPSISLLNIDEDNSYMSTAKALLALRDNIAAAFLGQNSAIELAIICLLADGHLLIEDVPGLGKTTLARAFARSIDLPLQRIQFTSDMLPSDILGVSLFDKEAGAFKFHKGPIFTSILLADEINRAEPRTQSALLEAMVERQITMDGETYEIKRPFMVIATQNPVDFSGTYPLPDSQLDRFLFCLSLGYPEIEIERKLLQNQTRNSILDALKPVISAAEFEEFARKVDEVHTDISVIDYLLQIAHKTRQMPQIKLGASTRASLDCLRAAKARALYFGRDFVLPDDIRELAIPALSHRIHPSPHAVKDSRQMLAEILEQIKMPL